MGLRVGRFLVEGLMIMGWAAVCTPNHEETRLYLCDRRRAAAEEHRIVRAVERGIADLESLLAGMPAD